MVVQNCKIYKHKFCLQPFIRLCQNILSRFQGVCKGEWQGERAEAPGAYVLHSRRMRRMERRVCPSTALRRRIDFGEFRFDPPQFVEAKRKSQKIG